MTPAACVQTRQVVLFASINGRPSDFLASNWWNWNGNSAKDVAKVPLSVVGVAQDNQVLPEVWMLHLEQKLGKIRSKKPIEYPELEGTREVHQSAKF